MPLSKAVLVKNLLAGDRKPNDRLQIRINPASLAPLKLRQSGPAAGRLTVPINRDGTSLRSLDKLEINSVNRETGACGLVSRDLIEFDKPSPLCYSSSRLGALLSHRKSKRSERAIKST